MIRPSSGIGVNTAERVPITMRALAAWPPAARRASRSRVGQAGVQRGDGRVEALLGSARPAAASGRSPGTAPAPLPPRASTAPAARRYTSVLPLPVTPSSRKAPEAPRFATMASTAARCALVRLGSDVTQPGGCRLAIACVHLHANSIQSLRRQRARSRAPAGLRRVERVLVASPPLARCPSSACCGGARRRPCSAIAFTPVAVMPPQPRARRADPALRAAVSAAPWRKPGRRDGGSSRQPSCSNSSSGASSSGVASSTLDARCGASPPAIAAVREFHDNAHQLAGGRRARALACRVQRPRRPRGCPARECDSRTTAAAAYRELLCRNVHPQPRSLNVRQVTASSLLLTKGECG